MTYTGINYQSILTIAGEGRNVGKTLLACNIISKFSRQYNIIGLKITAHKHRDTGDAKIVYQQGETSLLEETNQQSNKDTARMLAAGANRSFLLQTSESAIEDALIIFLSMIKKGSLIVCESGMLGTMNSKGLNLFVRQLNCQVSVIDKKISGSEINRIVTYTVNGFDIDLNKLVIENNHWKLTED